MKRLLKIFIMVMIFCVAMSCASFASNKTETKEITYRSINLIVNGTTVKPCDANGNSTEPFIVNSEGTTYLPVRAVANALGLNVNWNNDTNTVILTSGGTVKNGATKTSTNKTAKIKVTYRDLKITVDGTQAILVNASGYAVEPFIYNDSTYLPLRSVASALGCDVTWDETSNTVRMTEKKATFTVTPKNGATGVDTDEDIVLTFSETPYTIKGKTLTTSTVDDYVQDYITVHKTSATGTKCSYEASYNSSKKTITLEMDKDFADKTKYYVVVDANAFKNASGAYTAASSTYFTTGTGEGEIDDDVIDSISPKNKATGVAKDDTIVIKFKETPYDNDDNKLSSLSNLTNYVKKHVTINKEKSSGTSVSYTAKLSSKTLTLTPTSNLSDDTKYYINIDDKAFYNADDDYNDDISIYFTVGDSTDEVISSITPSNGATGVAVKPSIKISFASVPYDNDGEKLYDYTNTELRKYLDDYITIAKSSTSTSGISFSVEKPSSKTAKYFYITPSTDLDAATKYYITIKAKTFYDADDNYNSKVTSYFTTVEDKPVFNSFTTSKTESTITVSAKSSVAAKVTLVLSTTDLSGKKASEIYAGDILGTVDKKAQDIGTSSKDYKFEGLNASTTYYIYAVIYDSSTEKYSDIKATSVTTTAPASKLESLSVGDTAIEGFNPEKLTYTVELDTNTTTATINFEAPDNADVSISGGSGNSSYTASTGEGSVALTFSNTNYQRVVKITVTETDKSETTYTVTLKVKSNTSVNGVTVDGNDATKTASNAYEITLSKHETSVTVTFDLVDKSAKVTPETVSDLTTGDNVIEFTVKSNGKSEKYTVTIKNPSEEP